jgi:hypothetical protein
MHCGNAPEGMACFYRASLVPAASRRHCLPCCPARAQQVFRLVPKFLSKKLRTVSGNYDDRKPVWLCQCFVDSFHAGRSCMGTIGMGSLAYPTEA